MRYHFHIINEGKGFSAHCLEIEGLRTQGDTWAELENNIREVFELWFSDLNGYEDIPKPLKVLPDNPNSDLKAFPVSLEIAFRLELFWKRKEKGFTQRQMAELLGYNNLSAYQKIENGKSVPTLKIVDRISRKIPGLRDALFS